MANRTFPLWPLAVALLAALVFSGALSNVLADYHSFQQVFHNALK